MKVKIRIKRQVNSNSSPYIQNFVFECDGSESVSVLLEKINASNELKDEQNYSVKKINWECSCNQKKCGACAMVINKIPRLACNTFVHDVVGSGGVLSLEPLSKFPVVSDLVVDRSILYENIKTLKLWLEDETKEAESQNMFRYQAAKCLMCGCCLEVCPNFYESGIFGGGAIVPVTFGVLNYMDLKKHKKEIRKAYLKRFYEGCGGSMACRDICPAGVPLEELLVRTNSLVIWRK